MNSWWFYEVERSSGYTELLNKADRTRTFWICMVVLLGLLLSFVEPLQHIPQGICLFMITTRMWAWHWMKRWSVIVMQRFCSRNLALQFLANTLSTAEHLWWMKNRSLDFSHASSFFSGEFWSLKCKYGHFKQCLISIFNGRNAPLCLKFDDSILISFSYFKNKKTCVRLAWI